MTANDSPLVTVGLPTFKRPQFLERSLRSLIQQQDVRLEIIVADNNPEDLENEMIVSAVSNDVHQLRYVRHTANLGAAANFRYCLSVAQGKYFMWLADDDELGGDQHIATLLDVLEKEPDVVTAAAPWRLMESPETGHIQTHRDYASDRWLCRALKFAWRSDDDFIYSLHRTDVLRRAQWTTYWRPNRGNLANAAYPFLMDMILSGKIVRVEGSNIAWINHAYTDKLYSTGGGKRSVDLRFVLRRLNVHALYAEKVYRKGGALALIAVLTVSAMSLVNEALRIVGTYTKAKFVRKSIKH